MSTLAMVPHVVQHGVGQGGGLAVLLFSVGVGGLLDTGLTQLPSTLMAIASIMAAVATMLPQLSAFLDKLQDLAERRARARRDRVES